LQAQRTAGDEIPEDRVALCETVTTAVDTPPPSRIEQTDLARSLARSWGVEVIRLRYLPKGFGSYHWLAEAQDRHFYFLTLDDLGTKPWLGDDAESTFEGLQAAYGTALALHDHAQLDFVVPPVPSVDSRVAVRLGPQHSLALFEFIDGQPGQWGEPMNPGDREHLLGILARLHASTPAVPSGVPWRGLELPGRAGLEAALEELDRPWDGGPFSDMARREFAANVEVVREWLASFDALAARVATRAAPAVVTHGEPHPGNLIRVDADLRLIDWDTVALSQPERDLWMLEDDSGGSLAAYTNETGRAVDGTAIALYRLAWRLTDIALFTALLRSHHGVNEGTEKAWNGFRDSLHCCELPAYGR
jgi:spectinomycin phosphotransferase